MCSSHRFHLASPVIFGHKSRERDQKEILEPALNGELI